MRERERLLWSILIILLLIIAGYEGYNSYRIGKRVREYQEEIERQALGSEDPQLRQTIEEMEKELQSRLDYQFDVARDPLDLSHVIHARRFLDNMGLTESLESRGRMRLSCTVVSEQPAAIIKYEYRSYVMRVGDTLNGYRLAEVKPELAVLVRGGERLILATEKALDTQDLEKRRRDGGITVTAPDTAAVMTQY
ncbi:MAG: hypothetical protein C4524_04580 [Candidatus Zixiibacteriota bacterium]|nr:MAG: hypothetical protein C4524_04580 [candidate division Zixibacteria bacterium]